MNRHYQWLLFIIILAFGAIWLILPETQKPEFLLRGKDDEAYEECVRDLNKTDEDCARFKGEFEFLQGLDIVGGLRVLLEADVPQDTFTLDELQEAANNVERRVNALGLAEATIQVQGNSRVLIELPGETDEQQALSTIQQTALLEFVDFAGLNSSDYQFLTDPNRTVRILTTKQDEIESQRDISSDNVDGNPEIEDNRVLHPQTGQPFETVMTGSGLDKARAVFQDNQWMIQFELTSEGGEVFGPFTAARIGQPMAIVLDGEVLSAPTIQAELPTGGVITGRFTEEEAKTLALQLRSGSLPIPLRVESVTAVGATLGQESVELSIRAGIVGVIVVLAFMLIYYRVPGIAADFALMIFILLNLLIFKLLPVTLTLPAITGFLISVGTAVDGNILIFERLKEELRDGKKLNESLDAGFDRAWTSIRDSNLSTIIIAGILFWFGQTTPGATIVSGFAITLIVGLILNLFTAVLVTRTFLYIIVMGFKNQVETRKWLLGV